ncbi:MAG: glycosyltransferase [Bryobacteraceae bacterium]|nr:glycosyltransferase [Bryobacteraceae bacterium]
MTPRVAFFTDCFHEVNGVALTSRQLDAFAQRRGYPFFSFHIGPETKTWTVGEHTTMEIARGPHLLRLDSDMFFDLDFLRYRTPALDAVRAFRPDLVHITGPGDCGILGVIAARTLNVPLVASWHTDLHKYAGRRLVQMLEFLPEVIKEKLDFGAEKGALAATLQFYKLAKVTLAPNPDLVKLIEEGTGRPCHLMRRGIDSSIFSPTRRTRPAEDGTLVLGYVGRLSPEKGIRLLADVERALISAGVENYRFQVVGQGSELEWLQQNLQRADFPGVLRGEALATAYANLDLFLFPSRTDTFGNVIQEALASGVPAAVFAEGGPKFLVEPGESGIRAETDAEFVERTVDLVRDPRRLAALRAKVLASKLDRTWDGVFEDVYEAYRLSCRP